MDQWFLIFFNQTLANPLLDLVMIFFSTVGFALLPLSGVALLMHRPVGTSSVVHGTLSAERQGGKAILWALLFSMIYTGVFYYLALRPRPQNVRLLLPLPSFPSFPSGHTTIAFAVTTVLALSRDGLTIAKRIGFTLFAVGVFLFAGMVAISRIYLGHHYPSDVVGGVVAGVAVGAAAYGLFAYSGNRLQRIRWLLWPQIAIALTVTQMAYLGQLPIYLLRWPYADKFFHFLLFGAIVFWLNLWLEGRTVRQNRTAVFGAIPLAIALTFSIAFMEEGLQALSPLRTADLTDLGADLIGMFFFWWLSMRFIAREANMD